ncbi:MAG TPA: hypothetical protein VHO25_10105 [Polyangiaceae bacterium]|nr:hypothetical protein [Polyangiaceae bacterium]
MTTAAQVEVKETPIIFSGPMVRAILQGRKTQTRRVIKRLPDGVRFASPLPESDYQYRFTDFESHTDLRCPYGRPQLPLEPPRDRLWVRETWQPYREHSAEQNAVIKKSLDRFERGEVKDVVTEVKGWPFPPNGERKILYAADFGDWAYDVDSDLKHWKSPLFLPRDLSRITLEITDIRVERIQGISRADAIAEGVEPFIGKDTTAWRAGFQIGWDEINAKRGYSWSNNPWVWAITFKKL